MQKMKVNTCIVCEIGSSTEEDDGFWNFKYVIIVMHLAYFKSFVYSIPVVHVIKGL